MTSKRVRVDEGSSALEAEAARPFSTARRWRITRPIIALHLFALTAMVGLTLVAIVVVAVADAVQATPYGHVIDAPVPIGYIVGPVAVLLTFSQWGRSKGVVIILALTIALLAVSVTARVEPRSPDRPVPGALAQPW
jgi:hypothetical protein